MHDFYEFRIPLFPIVFDMIEAKNKSMTSIELFEKKRKELCVLHCYSISATTCKVNRSCFGFILV